MMGLSQKPTRACPIILRKKTAKKASMNRRSQGLEVGSRVGVSAVITGRTGDAMILVGDDEAD